MIPEQPTEAQVKALLEELEPECELTMAFRVAAAMLKTAMDHYHGADQYGYTAVDGGYHWVPPGCAPAEGQHDLRRPN